MVEHLNRMIRTDTLWSICEMLVRLRHALSIAASNFLEGKVLDLFVNA